MPVVIGVQRTSFGTDLDRRTTSLHRPRLVTALVVAFLAAVGNLVPAPALVPVVEAGQSPRPKAVIIVGPTHEVTSQNLADGEKMARQAEAAGMDVRRVFFPKATWANVLANVQGASLVVYLGHGYGWPSKYTKTLTESRQNGMGLNTYEGSGRADYRYYGATPIREKIRLAPNAVVMLIHLCYAPGAGEPGMAIPSVDLARERADNFASGFLGAGARAVFAFSWYPRLNYPSALAKSDATMDQLFMTPGTGTPAGFIGWRNVRFDSVRTPGAMNHLDPHKSYGYYRALSGDLNMTAAEWRSGAVQSMTANPTSR